MSKNPAARTSRTNQEDLKETIKEAFREALRDESCHVVSSARPDGNGFFRQLNEEILDKLSGIYSELNRIQKTAGEDDKEKEGVSLVRDMMDDASERLHQIIKATEKATFTVIDLVECSLKNIENMKATIVETVQDDAAREKLSGSCAGLEYDMMEIMTTMSFQDLTGQRIKRVIDAINKVRDMIRDLYVSTDYILKEKSRQPDKNLKDLRDEASRITQDQVDAILSQMDAK